MMLFTDRLHTPRTMARVRCPTHFGRSLFSSQHPFRPQIGSHFQHQPVFGAPADFPGQNGYRHRQVFLHLFLGTLRICLW